MQALLGVSRAIDALTGWIGRIAAWAIVAAILISAANAIVRKAFDLSSNAWLELQWLLFGAVFMLCASWAFAANEHIRIDIVSQLLPRRVRVFIEYFGHVFFLFGMAALMTYLSWPFFKASWSISEQSVNAGGLVVWPAKLLILAGFFLLALQAISELIKRMAISAGLLPDTVLDAGGHHAAAEAEAERLRVLAAEEARRHEGGTPPKAS
jgi:TRAP-type mannitol/chloroaromatic compound transport system permease small subunit